MTPTETYDEALRLRFRLPFGKRPTDGALRLLGVLVNRPEALQWSHAALAKAAGCCEKTVRNSLKRLRDLGLLAWTRRVGMTAAGFRGNLANAYRFSSNLPLPSLPAVLNKIQKRYSLSCPVRVPAPVQRPAPAPRRWAHLAPDVVRALRQRDGIALA